MTTEHYNNIVIRSLSFNVSTMPPRKRAYGILMMEVKKKNRSNNFFYLSLLFYVLNVCLITRVQRAPRATGYGENANRVLLSLQRIPRRSTTSSENRVSDDHARLIQILTRFAADEFMDFFFSRKSKCFY